MVILDKELELLHKIISKFYHQPKIEKVQSPPTTKKIERLIKEKIPKKKVEKVEDRLSSWAIGVIVVGIIGGGLLLIPPKIPDIIGIMIIIFSIMVGLILYSSKGQKEKTITVYDEVEKVVVEDEIVEGKIIEKIIPNNYSIKGITKCFVPFSCLKVNDNNIFIGPKEIFNEDKLSFPTIKRFDKFYEIFDQMEKSVEKIPFVLKGETKQFNIKEETSYGSKIELRGLESQIMQEFKLIEEIFKETYNIDFKIPVINYDHLRTHIVQLDTSIDIGDKNLITDYLNSDEGSKLDYTIRKWIEKWKKYQNILHFIRFESLRDQVGNLCYDLSNILSYSAFNFYCPGCNGKVGEELLKRDYLIQSDVVNEPIYFSKNTRCVYQIDKEVWKCKTCEKETQNPIPIHKCYDEIFMPAYDKLIEENLNERIKAHNDTRTKEIQYENEMESEVDKLSYENLSAIYSLTDEMERLRAEIGGENDAIKSLNEVSSEFQIKQNKTLDSIKDYSEKIFKEILNKTKEIIAEVDNVKNDQMDKLEKELNELSRAKRKEDEIRDSIQREILQANKEQVEVSKQGFSMVGDKLNNINEGIERGNVIAEEGFQNVSGKLDESVNATREGFNKIDKTIEHGTKDLAHRVSQGNAIQSALAKKQGVNIHDEPFWRIDRKLSKAFVDVKGAITGITTHEKEEEKLNG